MSVHEAVVVAIVRRAHGLEGELLVHLETDYPDDVFVERRILRVSGGGPVGVASELTLRSARPHAGGWVLGFEEIPDRTLAERYAGRHLSLAADELVERGEREYFLHELQGLEMRHVDGRAVGVVETVYEAPGAPLLAVRSEGRERLVPFRGEFVEEVDVEEGVIRVRPPAGLLEL